MSRRKIGKAILRSNFFQTAAAHVIHNLLRFTYMTNRNSDDVNLQVEHVAKYQPAIFTVWHGQHFLLPYFYGGKMGRGLVAMVSRSADAQINAKVMELAGHSTVRGSGGRVRKAATQKGGASATLALKNALASGYDVGIIADISKGTPRQSGKGVVSLAKISGRPIIPLALATSRYKVLERSWDKTTINLPFGQSCVRAGNPIYVPSESSGEELDMWRKKVDDELNRITEEVYDVVGAKP